MEDHFATRTKKAFLLVIGFFFQLPALDSIRERRLEGTGYLNGDRN